jgi:hypothetical protein
MQLATKELVTVSNKISTLCCREDQGLLKCTQPINRITTKIFEPRRGYAFIAKKTDSRIKCQCY